MLFKDNRKKMVYLRFNVDGKFLGTSMETQISIYRPGQNLERVNTFKYLAAALAENGDLDAEMTHRIQSGWKNWKRVPGILCDRRISLRVKGKYTILCKTSNDVFVRCLDLGSEESTREEVGCGRNEDVKFVNTKNNEFNSFQFGMNCQGFIAARLTLPAYVDGRKRPSEKIALLLHRHVDVPCSLVVT